MFKMGGLHRRLPVAFWTFLIGSASLCALPLITAGFYSKDLILWSAFSSPAGNLWLWGAGLAGAFLTSVYTFRMVFLTFFGQEKSQVTHKPTLRMKVSLVILAGLSIVAGFVELPPFLGNFNLFSNFLGQVLPETGLVRGGPGTELVLTVIAGVVSLAGIYLAYQLFLRRTQITSSMVRARLGGKLHSFWFSGWGFDWLYNRLFVWPVVWLAKANKEDIVDSFFDGVAWLAGTLNRVLSLTQTGHVRWYALGLVIGAILLVGAVVFL